MKITYRKLPHPDHPGSFLLMGQTFLKGEQRMSSMPLPPWADERKAQKTIKRAFRAFRDGLLR